MERHEQASHNLDRIREAWPAFLEELDLLRERKISSLINAVDEKDSNKHRGAIEIIDTLKSLPRILESEAASKNALPGEPSASW